MANRANVAVSFDKHLKQGQTISDEITGAIGLKLEDLSCNYSGDGWYFWKEIKWTSDDEDMIAISKEYPEIVFEARVNWLEGEMCPEYSEYYRNGVSTETASDFGIIDRSQKVYELNVGDVLEVIKGDGYKQPNAEQLTILIEKISKTPDFSEIIRQAVTEVGLEELENQTTTLD